MEGHVPVLLKETLGALALHSGDDVIDGTLGGGGHASAILEAIGPAGRLLGIEWDSRTLEETRKSLERFGSRAMLVHSNYRDMGRLARTYDLSSVSAILLDLGYSSFQIDDPERGFSFRFAGKLDMRYDESSDQPTAADLLNSWPQADLAHILREYGEEGAAGRIAAAIVAARRHQPIETADALVKLVIKTVGRGKGKINPATQTFQALRIAVNGEFDNLRAALTEAVKLLRPATAGRPGGRLAIISFHSLEDRIVKEFFRDCPDLEALTKRPLVAAEDEVDDNRRSRSAKLRVAARRPLESTPKP
jgi:16S rRNA (cytosine1402-N4)-methyltransferase